MNQHGLNFIAYVSFLFTDRGVNMQGAAVNVFMYA